MTATSKRRPSLQRSTKLSQHGLKKDISLRKKKIHHTDKFMFGTKASDYLTQMERFRENGYIRQNIFGKEVIWNGTRYVFTAKKERKNMKHLFIFGLTKRDAVKYSEEKKIKKSKWLPSIKYNDKVNIKGKRIIGTDIDGAYWNLAYRMGVISEKTYNHGVRINNKMLCLAALSSLGADKHYHVIRNGKLTEKLVIVQGDNDLKEIYKQIRFNCFSIMQQIARMLGNDFICYRTDCIYYIHTKENTKMVRDFLHDNELDYKMVYDMTRSMSKKY